MSSVDDSDSTADVSDTLTSDDDDAELACGGVREGGSLLQYDGLPHMMGKPPVAVFSVKPEKDKVRFSSVSETFSGPVDVPLQWDCVTSDIMDKDPLGEKFPQKKT